VAATGRGAMKPEHNLEARAELFKSLGHPARLLMLNLIRQKPRHVEELAAILNLSAATVSHHLTKLAEAGLLKSEKDQYYQVYSLTGDWLDRTLGEVALVPQEGMDQQVEEDAYRKKVLQTFFKRGRLVEIPAQLKKRQIVLARIAEEFEPDRAYTEREVNQVLVEFHDDVASLRRGLISDHLMNRVGGVYRRVIEDKVKS
jgi:ArsR family transcriptional regulator, arsenate/arsenite/antimonite-responsive transcriptional repressor